MSPGVSRPTKSIPLLSRPSTRLTAECLRYYEGLKVLYASNTFQIRNSDTRAWGGFTLQIPEIGFSYITSIEIVVVTDPIDYYDDQGSIVCFDDELFHIPSLMPRLKELYVGFLPEVFAKDEVAIQFEFAKFIGGIVENIVRELRRMNRFCELELGIPSSFFMGRALEASKKHSRVCYSTPRREPGVRGKTTYIKHPRHRLFWPIEDQQLDLGSEDRTRGDADVGYWLSESEFDNVGYGLPW